MLPNACSHQVLKMMHIELKASTEIRVNQLCLCILKWYVTDTPNTEKCLKFAVKCR